MADSELAASHASLADWARRLGVAGFFAWWRRELAAAVPARVSTAIERRRLRPVIAFESERITLWRPTAQGEAVGVVEIASIAASADAATLVSQGRAALDAMFADKPGERDVTVALGPKQVLRRRLVLPAAVEDNLRATIGYDLDRLTPFKADDLDFDAAVAHRDAARREIAVDIVAVRRRTLDQVLTTVRSFGANVVAVVATPPREAAASRFNLLAPDERSGVRTFLRWQTLVPLAVVAVLVAAIIVVPLWQKREYAIAMMNTADAAAVRAKESDRLRSELDRMVGEYNFALERKYTTPGVAQVLDEVTRLLPDDTWLTQFEVKSTVRGKVTQRDVYMRGESANAGKLISLLENATLVGHAAPRSPTTKLQPGPGESFDIGAQLKPTLPPQKLALTETVAPRVPVAAARAPDAGVAAPAAPAATGDAAAPAPAAKPTPNAGAKAAGAPGADADAGADAAPAAEPATPRGARARARGQQPAGAGEEHTRRGARGAGRRGQRDPSAFQDAAPARAPASVAPGVAPVAPPLDEGASDEDSVDDSDDAKRPEESQ